MIKACEGFLFSYTFKFSLTLFCQFRFLKTAAIAAFEEHFLAASTLFRSFQELLSYVKTNFLYVLI